VIEDCSAGSLWVVPMDLEPVRPILDVGRDPELGGIHFSDCHRLPTTPDVDSVLDEGDAQLESRTHPTTPTFTHIHKRMHEYTENGVGLDNLGCNHQIISKHNKRVLVV